ncbi:craniofacial development protein 1 isoform X1 [Fundulus heteroclitus]|uniref:craniofacial development protein 1 isoform X1 n=1 Tax=Fundulus heteroclitus TaxID=8078 RepID=UPI00165C11EA|nr:craniofacial development protein 1 isoform X1 [Fundulus heteroclitus]
MSYSDYDSDGYLSHEDADYVPSDDNLSEDDINECEKEDLLHEDDGVPHPDHVLKKKKRRKDISMRKKRGKLKQGEKDGTEEAQLHKQDSDDEEKRKKKSDDLWASFLSDVGSRPNDSAPACKSESTDDTESSVIKGTSLSTETKPSQPAKVTITKVFDFAGEEVRVNKEVSIDSKEAKSYLKSQSTQQEEDEDEETLSSPTQPSLPGPSAKRPAGMSSILSRIGGKKQKMSTLEKSKMDWDAFKSEEGITEELAIHNRGREGMLQSQQAHPPCPLKNCQSPCMLVLFKTINELTHHLCK